MDCLLVLAFILAAHCLVFTRMVPTKIPKLLGGPVLPEVKGNWRGFTKVFCHSGRIFRNFFPGSEGNSGTVLEFWKHQVVPSS